MLAAVYNYDTDDDMTRTSRCDHRLTLYKTAINILTAMLTFNNDLGPKAKAKDSRYQGPIFHRSSSEMSLFVWQPVGWIIIMFYC